MEVSPLAGRRYKVNKVMNLGSEKSMLFFHAVTDCDAVSAFRDKGKKTARQVILQVKASYQNRQVYK